MRENPCTRNRSSRGAYTASSIDEPHEVVVGVVVEVRSHVVGEGVTLISFQELRMRLQHRRLRFRRQLARRHAEVIVEVTCPSQQLLRPRHHLRRDGRFARVLTADEYEIHVSALPCHSWSFSCVEV